MPEQTAVADQQTHTPEEARGRGLLAPALAVLAAFGASLCCVGPILFVTLGVGAGLASTFEPLRPLFSALALVGLGIGFYTVYGRSTKEQACAPGDVCARPRSRRRDEVLLWGATLLALLFWSFPTWSLFLI